MNLELTPRVMGNPAHQLARSKKEIVNFIRWNNGHAPVFAAHNAYPSYTETTIPEPLSILYECTPYDFDDEDDISKPHEDALKLATKIDEEGGTPRIRYSGAKGYHVYRTWKPITISVRSDGQRRALKDIIRTVQINDVRELGLSTMDGRVISDYRRLMRVPNTRWAKEVRLGPGHNKEVSVGDAYCISLTLDELRTMEPSEVLALSKNPRKQSFAPVHGKISILEYIHQQGLEISAYKSILGSLPGTYAKSREVPDDLIKQYVQKVCVQMDAFSSDPSHLTRFAVAAYLTQLGFTRRFIIDFIQDLAEKGGWVDFDRSVTEYHVENILFHKYRPPTCTRLKQEGLCIGPECPIYREV